MRYGKRYAYVERGYTLLTPGALWYPTTLPPENPSSVYDAPVDFTRFTLRVRNPERLTVISQGRRSGTPEDIRFRDEHPLPGISLCMGDYVRFRTGVDGTTYEVYLLRGHERLLDSYFASQTFEIKEAVRMTRYIAEHEMGREYPFARLMLVETPVHFASYYRPERGASQYVQPELILGGEWGREWLDVSGAGGDVGLKFDPFLREEDLTEVFSWSAKYQRYDLRNWGKVEGRLHAASMNPLLCRSLFYGQMPYLRSSRYPFVHAMMQTLLRDNNTTSDGGRETDDYYSEMERELMVSHYLRNRSFEEVCADSSVSQELMASVLLRESREFLNRLMVCGVAVDSVRNFVNAYFAGHPFQVVDFVDFNTAFRRRFGVDMDSVLAAQYERKGLPSYIVEPLGEEVSPVDNNVRYSHFRVYNDSDVDGFIHVEKYIQREDDSPYFWYRRNADFQYEAYEVKAHTGIEVRTRSFMATVLHTNLALNVPESYSIPIIGYGTDTSQYVRPAAKESFFPAEGEIVVDNEGEGFSINQPGGSLLERWREGKRMPWEKYYTGVSGLATSRWKMLVREGCYGGPLRSCIAKAAGDGTCSVEWRANLPRAGKYEIWLYVPFVRFSGEEDVYVYTVKQETWQETIELGDFIPKRWILLGTFDCQSGDCAVSLSDKGQNGQIVYGDAVKWVTVKE